MKTIDRRTTDPRAPEFLFLTRPQWVLVAFTAAFAAAAVWPLCRDNAPGTVYPVAMTAAVLIHMTYASRYIVPLPHVAILIALLQCALAPWASLYYPTHNPVHSVSDISEYQRYTNPALAATILGWLLPLVGLRTVPIQVIQRGVNPALKQTLDWLLIGGIAFNSLQRFFSFGPLGFAVFLLGNLRYVGGIGFALYQFPGWRMRLVLLLLFEVFVAVGTGMFHGLVLWGLVLFAVLSFLKWRSPLRQMTYFALIAVIVFSLHDVKWQIRNATWSDGTSKPTGTIRIFNDDYTMSLWNRPLIGVLCLCQSISKIWNDGYDRETLGDFTMRFNQGWIIARVIHHVPSSEPYAKGKTIWMALRSAALPRVLDPGKPMAGGRLLMEKYAGYRLAENTAMDLGFIGEAYANFGETGGVVLCFGYCFFFGLLFRWIASRAQRSLLWWAVAAFTGYWALKAESDIGSVLNFVIKAGIVILILRVLPSFGAELARLPHVQRRRTAQQAPTPPLEPTDHASSWSPEAPAQSKGNGSWTLSPPGQPSHPMPAPDFIKEEKT